MNELCFLSNMTSSEWAAWVQAIGSIVAIFGAAYIAIWQSGKQHKNSLELLHAERRLARIEVALALLSLSTNCQRLLKSYAAQLSNLEAIHKIAEGKSYFDLNELKIVEGAVHSISLHTLPHQLVGLTMLVSSTVRQFRENIERALQLHHTLNAAKFDKFFVALSQMQNSLIRICNDIQEEVVKLESEA